MHETANPSEAFTLPVERGDTIVIQGLKHEIEGITSTGLIHTTHGTYGKSKFMGMIEEAGEVKIVYEC